MQKSKSFVVKSLSLVLAVVFMLALASCGKNGDESKITTKPATTAAPTTLSPYVMNPLTGIENLPRDKENTRPVAVMINNIKVAQDVQTGLNDADMVFETLVEGGITRLMAVYSNISKIGQIGTVRSSRYSYAQLACGLDARYVHCGSDNKYCTPLMRELGLDDLDLGGNASSAAKRISNGHDWEHTLYTYGDKLNTLYKKGRTEIKDSAKNVYSFNSEKSPVKYKTEAESFKVKFSDSYTTSFTFEDSSKKYIRGDRSGDALVDYVTDKKERFTNVLVLYTSVHYLSDNHHMKSELDSGSGTYYTNGTKVNIKWSKGDSSSPLKFTNEDGTALKLNAGNSYICITDTSNK